VLRADGHTISHIDLGGGLGIPYREDNEPPPDPDAYAAIVKRATHNLGCKLIFEPGRLIVGNAGILVTRVLYMKRGEAKNFIIVDAGMNDLIRPTLYEAITTFARCGRRRPAKGTLWPTWSVRSANPATFLALDRSMPAPQAGDLLAIMSAGAYGATQSGTYNSRPLVPESACPGRRMGGDPAACHRRRANRDGPAAGLALAPSVKLSKGLLCYNLQEPSSERRHD